MSALRLQRTSAGQAAWIIGLLFFAWLVFLFLPVPWTKKAPPATPVPGPPSQLRVAGLRDNPDWDGLPELFAIWSGSAEWIGDKTQFAYWHPGNRSYAYLFEATRQDGKVRFRILSKAEAFASRVFEKDGGYVRSDAGPGPARLVEPTFEAESSTHPFVFFHDLTLRNSPAASAVRIPELPDSAATPPRMRVETLPPAKLNPTEIPAPDDPKRK